MPVPEDTELDLNNTTFALALSGGGYRATLFHLGVMRRLNELDWLPRIERIVSVSGGSLLLGYLMCRIPDVLDRKKTIDPNAWTREVSEKVHKFTTNDLRTLQTIANLALYTFAFRGRRVANAMSRLQKLYGDQTMGDFAHGSGAHWPEIFIMATDCAQGQPFRFSNVRKESGNSQIGMGTLYDTPVATACMASACFPPLFGPFFPRLNPDDFSGGRLQKKVAEGEISEQDRRDVIEGIALSDGGLYDNLGSNLVIGATDDWVRLYSDAGNPLTPSTKDVKSIKIGVRYLKLMSNFIGRLNFQRVYASQKNAFSLWSGQFRHKDADKDTFGFSRDMIDDYLEHVRTDLDTFTEAEAKILENHGYAQTDIALRHDFGTHYPKGLPKAKWPYPDAEFTDPALVRPVLMKARKRKMLSQLTRLQLVDPAKG